MTQEQQTMNVDIARFNRICAERDRLREINKELLAACKAVGRLDYLQEHNALAQQLQAAIAKADMSRHVPKDEGNEVREKETE